MQKNTIFSFIVWDNVSRLPFPEEVKQIMGEVNWPEFEWQVQGLPIPFARYSVLDGKVLYLDELADGTSKTERVEKFTGKVLITAMIQDKNIEDGYNYIVSFLVTFLKGEFVEAELDKKLKHSAKEYEAAFGLFQTKMKQIMTRQNKWWFRFIYVPWAIVIRFISYCLLLFLNTSHRVIVTVVEKLTPF